MTSVVIDVIKLLACRIPDGEVTFIPISNNGNKDKREFSNKTTRC